MRIGILTCEQYFGLRHLGSTRIRARWPLRYWPEAEEFRADVTYDVLIFQKAYDVPRAAAFPGVKILDICDPDFLRRRTRIEQMVEHCDAVTCSSVPLVEDMRGMTGKPVRLVADRIDFAAIGTSRKHHSGPTRTVAWFGNSQNLPVLDPTISMLLEFDIRTLLVVATAGFPYTPPSSAAGRLEVVNLPWSEDSVHRHLLRADVVLNPRVEAGEWRYKSLNKTTLAWALGLPVAHTRSELEALMTEEQRRREARLRRLEVRQNYDVRDTVRDYRRLIEELSQSRRQICDVAQLERESQVDDA
jgi:hypothetical protein